eukprot:GILJ01010878.1.p1 GENE.GILJ01010878.1~~GILJ01010878.1.p1  ORF type:complete len:1327 (-),score=226.61 GILJ01010878.1:92-4033(-)
MAQMLFSYLLREDVIADDSIRDSAARYWAEQNLERCMQTLLTDLLRAQPRSALTYLIDRLASINAERQQDAQLSPSESMQTGMSVPASGIISADGTDMGTYNDTSLSLDDATLVGVIPFGRSVSTAYNATLQDSGDADTLVPNRVPTRAVVDDGGEDTEDAEFMTASSTTDTSQMSLALPVAEAPIAGRRLNAGTMRMSDTLVRVLSSLQTVSTKRQKEALLNELIGCRIDGRFEIVETIGIGGSGVVFRCADTFIVRDVAVKLLLSPIQAEANDFLREATVVSVLSDCDDIMKVYHFGSTDNGMLYQIMELLRGDTLSGHLKRLPEGKLTDLQTVLLAVSVLNGLEAAHSTQIVHRDLKPDNIFVCSLNQFGVRAKILDWGTSYWNPQQVLVRAASRSLSSSSLSLNRTSSRVIPEFDHTIASVGTLRYMPREQFLHVLNRSIPLDGRTDLFALATTLFQCLNGSLPAVTSGFQAVQQSFTSYLHTMGDELKDPIISAVDAWTAEPVPLLIGESTLLHQAIRKGMEKMADDRFVNASSFKQALQDAMDLGEIDGNFWTLLSKMSDNTVDTVSVASLTPRQRDMMEAAISVNQNLKRLEGNTWSLSRTDLADSTLNLSDCGVDSCSIRMIMSWVSSQFNITSLDLHGNQVNDESIQILCSKLPLLPNLNDLNISNNAFGLEGAEAVAVYLSQDLNLKRLDISYNYNIGDEGAVSIFSSLVNNHHLEMLSMKGVGVNDSAMSSLAVLIESNQTLLKLYLNEKRDLEGQTFAFVLQSLISNRSITSLSVPSVYSNLTGLDQLLRANSTLVELDLNQSCVESASMALFADGFSCNSTLKQLSWGMNNLDAESIKSVTAALPESSVNRLRLESIPASVINSLEFWFVGTMKDLQLEQLSMDKETTRRLCEAVAVCEQLERLSLKSITSEEMDCVVLGQFVGSTRTLKTLQLCDCKVKEIQELCQGIAANTTLTELNLSENRDLQNSMHLLFTALRDGSCLSLLSLDLSRTGMTYNGLEIFTDYMIRKGASLTSLNLSNTTVRSNGLVLLSAALRENRTLTHLDLSSAMIVYHETRYRIEGESRVVEAIAADPELQELNIDISRGVNASYGNASGETAETKYDVSTQVLERMTSKVDLEGFNALSQALCENDTLKELSLQFNKLGNLCSRTLARCLQRNRTLEVLDLSHNQIEDEGAMYLANALGENFNLSSLGLRNNAITVTGAQPLWNAIRSNRCAIRLEKNKVFKKDVDTARANEEAGRQHADLLNQVNRARSGFADQGYTISGRALRVTTWDRCQCAVCNALRRQPDPQPNQFN